MKVVILCLVNEHGEVLLARRAATLSTDAGVWSPSVSGKVDAGETYVQAALREANEELEIAPDQLSPVFLHNETHNEHTDGHERQFGIYYATVKKDIIHRLTPDPREVAEVAWSTQLSLQALVAQQSDTLIVFNRHPTLAENFVLFANI